MKGLLAGLVLFVSVSSGQNKTATDTVMISGQYKIEISYSNLPNLLSKLIVGAAKIIGFAPKELFYLETVTKINNDKEDDFRMDLKDQDGKEWLRVDSDTSIISFAEPPRSKRDILRTDGVKFVADLRNFFKKPGASKFTASFKFGRDTLTFKVLGAALGSIDTAYQKYHPSRYIFSSENQKGELYMRCEFLVGFEDKIIVYPQIKAHLYEKKMDFDINLKNLVIKK
ncbi:MAG: hypothetical protein ABSE68_01475 [Minisyncoccia bacterium]